MCANAGVHGRDGRNDVEVVVLSGRAPGGRRRHQLGLFRRGAVRAAVALALAAALGVEG